MTRVSEVNNSFAVELFVSEFSFVVQYVSVLFLEWLFVLIIMKDCPCRQQWNAKLKLTFKMKEIGSEKARSMSLPILVHSFEVFSVKALLLKEPLLKSTIYFSLLEFIDFFLRIVDLVQNGFKLVKESFFVFNVALLLNKVFHISTFFLYPC